MKNPNFFYDKRWKRIEIPEPSLWSSWEITKDFKGKKMLEIGPGSFPRIPVKGSYFRDLSPAAIAKLKSEGGKATVGSAEELPYPEGFFDLVVACEVLEHLENDEKALSEIKRVLKRGGLFYFSTPLHMRFWSPADEEWGHERRYDPDDLAGMLRKHGFSIRATKDQGFFYKLIHTCPPFRFISKKIFALLAERKSPTLLLNLLLIPIKAAEKFNPQSFWNKEELSRRLYQNSAGVNVQARKE